MLRQVFLIIRSTLFCPFGKRNLALAGSIIFYRSAKSEHHQHGRFERNKLQWRWPVSRRIWFLSGFEPINTKIPRTENIIVDDNLLRHQELPQGRRDGCKWAGTCTVKPPHRPITQPFVFNIIFVRSLSVSSRARRFDRGMLLCMVIPWISHSSQWQQH